VAHLTANVTGMYDMKRSQIYKHETLDEILLWRYRQLSMFVGDVAFIHRPIITSPYSEMQPHPVPSLMTTVQYKLQICYCIVIITRLPELNKLDWIGLDNKKR